MIQIVPSLLATPLGTLLNDLSSVVAAGARVIHVDVMDGQFVPPISFGANMVTFAKSVPTTFVEAHLMTIDPERHLEGFVEAGADRIIIHQEVAPHLHRLLGRIRAMGVSPGVAINPATPAIAIDEVIELADIVLVMTVNPGWGGQPFIPQCLTKVRAIADRIQQKGLPTIIEVDGGVAEHTVPLCISAGASLLVAGSSVFGRDDPGERFTTLQSIAVGAHGGAS